MKYFLKVLKQYADFNGRARRKEYWTFALFNVLFSVLAILLDNLTGMAMDGMGYGPIYCLYVLAVLVPGLAVAVRRLHDVGKSGWMLLVALIPLVGAIWLLVLMFRDSMPAVNQFGPNPKQETTYN